MTTHNRQLAVGIAVAALIVILFAYFFLAPSEDKGNEAPPTLSDTVAEEESKTGTEEDTTSPDVSVIGEDDVALEETLIGDVSISAPDLDRPVTFSDSMPEEARALYREKIGTLTTAIKETGGTISEWLSLGILWKQVGDYEGARLAWEYVAAVRPEGSIAFLNLGDLFHYYLKDYSKAEANFKQGILNDPSYVPAYLGLHELYKYSYKQNTAAAVTALQSGLSATDNNVNLLVSLASYYAEKGDTDNARTYYEQALQKAQEAGDTARAALIEAELNRL